MTLSKILTILGFSLLSLTSFGQVSAGHIVFERKTNIYKKFKDVDFIQDLPESQKIKIDLFDLYFNDTASYFGPIVTDEKESEMSWVTIKNSTYQNLSSNTLYSIKNLWGNESHVIDTIRTRTWRLVPGKRKICGYECQKALWQVNDSVKVFVYFANELTSSVGPESFNGLPGTILGAATEDGGVVYFAKEVLLERVDPAILIPKKTKGKIYKTADLKALLTKQYGESPWGSRMINEVFGIW